METPLLDIEAFPTLRSDRTEAIQKGRPFFEALTWETKPACGIIQALDHVEVIIRAKKIFGDYELSICDFQRESQDGEPLYEVGVLLYGRLIAVRWHHFPNPVYGSVVADLTKDQVCEILAIFSCYAPKNKGTCWQSPNQKIRERN